ncbi:MAG: sulfate permease [Bacteroidetes bacterium]|nr:MAG: sulfate permease [Bacteroidota bacterium]
MKIDFSIPNFQVKENLKYDLPSGIAVFFVAVPLCLGIAHASGAPLMGGLISGVIGGVIVGLFSGSELSVTGPAAGLTAIVLSGIQTLGSYEAFLLATVLAGVFQIAFGLFRTGELASYIPNSVIKGMLSAIGLILIIKQFPHLIGYDIEEMGVEEFAINKFDINEQYTGDKDAEANTFTVFWHAVNHINKGVLITGLVSLLVLVLWDKKFQQKFKIIPGAMLVVIVGVLVSYFINNYVFVGQLATDHYVNVPKINSITGFINSTSFPKWSMLFNLDVLRIGLTIAIVASIETLLSTEAIDKLDPLKRKTNNNQELLAQGSGNILAGLLGGIPITAVIVRGSVNVSAGGKTRIASVTHGLLIIVAVMFLASIINLIPLASLAAILIYTGFKLFSPAIFVEEFKKGYNQFLPFALTVTAIVLSDLLIGVALGILLSIVIVVFEDYKVTTLRIIDYGTRKRLVLGENITFLHKKRIATLLDKIPENSVIEIDGSRTQYIDKDVQEVIINFKQHAHLKNIEVIFGKINFMDGLEKEELKENMRKSYERLFVNNQKWVDDKTMNDPEYFSRLSAGQTPQYLFIGCSDSRVPANEITGTDPGEMFVHRNIANMVVNTDVNMLSVVQYGVEVLNVKHIIVCGHYGCGGIKAAVEHKSNGLIDKWLRNIKDVYRLHKDELDAITDSDLRHRRLVEVNVKEQVINLMKTSFIQKNINTYGFPQVHGWVYDISNGKLIDLDVDINKELPDYKDIYEIDNE